MAVATSLFTNRREAFPNQPLAAGIRHFTSPRGQILHEIPAAFHFSFPPRTNSGLPRPESPDQVTPGHHRPEGGAGTGRGGGGTAGGGTGKAIGGGVMLVL